MDHKMKTVRFGPRPSIALRPASEAAPVQHLHRAANRPNRVVVIRPESPDQGEPSPAGTDHSSPGGEHSLPGTEHSLPGADESQPTTERSFKLTSPSPRNTDRFVRFTD